MDIYVVAYETGTESLMLGAWRSLEAAQEGAVTLASERHPQHEQHKWEHDGETLIAHTTGGGEEIYTIGNVTLAD